MANDTAVVARGTYAFVKRSQTEVLLDKAIASVCVTLAASELVPKAYRGKPADIHVAAAWGASLGLDILQSLKGIAVINGNPSLWGDALLALARNHGVDVIETWDAQTMTATARVRRAGQEDVVESFSWDDAQKAGLTNRDTYRLYPRRMLGWRAKGYAIRAAMADLLMGFDVEEPDPQEAPALSVTISPAHLGEIGAASRAAGWTSQQVRELAQSFGAQEPGMLPVAYLDAFLATLRGGYGAWREHDTSRTSKLAQDLAQHVAPTPAQEEPPQLPEATGGETVDLTSAPERIPAARAQSQAALDWAKK